MVLLAAIVGPGPASGSDNAAPPPPRVRVAATEADPSLREWLVVRLLEEGYAVAGDDGAEIDLAIQPAAQLGWTVRAQGETTETFTVSIDEDEAVARLELLHRAVDALGSVIPRDRPANASSRAFAIELAPTFESEGQAAVEAEIALAVLEGGGSLAPDRSSAAFTVCASPGESGTHVDVVRGDAPCPTPADDATVLAPARTLTVQLVETALLSADDAPEPEPEPEPATEPATDDERAPIEEPDPMPAPSHRRTWSDSSLVVRGGASAGVIGRLIAADAMVGASLFIGREPGVAAWIDLQVWPATAPGPLWVLETLPAAGVRVRPFVDGRFALDVGALVGVQTHSYRFVEGTTTRDWGVTGDFSLEGALGFAFRLWREHELQLMFRVGRSGRKRRHTFEGRTVWEREAWRVGGTVGFTFGRRIR